jgi:hypothetical protein
MREKKMRERVRRFKCWKWSDGGRRRREKKSKETE